MSYMKVRRGDGGGCLDTIRTSALIVGSPHEVFKQKNWVLERSPCCSVAHGAEAGAGSDVPPNSTSD